MEQNNKNCDSRSVAEFFCDNDMVFCERYYCLLTKCACDERRVVKSAVALSRFRDSVCTGCIGCVRNVDRLYEGRNK